MICLIYYIFRHYAIKQTYILTNIVFLKLTLVCFAMPFYNNSDMHFTKYVQICRLFIITYHLSTT